MVNLRRSNTEKDQLKRGLGHFNNPQGTISIKRHEFDTVKYINAFDLEKVLQAVEDGNGQEGPGLVGGVGGGTSHTPGDPRGVGG